jgi:YVTN family beta-propeller protein
MNTKKIALLFISMALLFTSCSNDDDVNLPAPLGDYEDGILISHEGNFGQGNASVSFASYDLVTVENNIFSSVNANPLGDTAQSIAFSGDLAYIVLNVSNSIEIVNRYTFESVATIDTGLNNPRFIAFANGKGYVTNWGDGSVATDDYLALINLTTNTLDAQIISVEEGPEAIIADGNTLYIAHKGGFGQNNIISVVDASTNMVSTTINVGDVPSSLQLDGSGNLWVLSRGKPSWTGDETAGQLSKINTSDNSITTIDFGATEHPNHLALDNGALYYYMSGSVYKMASSATTLPSTAELTGLSFYGMTVNNSVLYGVDAADFTSNGTLSAYDLSSNTLSNSATVNIIPSGIYFN